MPLASSVFTLVFYLGVHIPRTSEFIIGPVSARFLHSDAVHPSLWGPRFMILNPKASASPDGGAAGGKHPQEPCMHGGQWQSWLSLESQGETAGLCFHRAGETCPSLNKSGRSPLKHLLFLAGGRAHWVKGPAANPDDLSSVPQAHVVGEK